MAKNVGILTAGGDCPGLNAAIRAIGKGAMNTDMRVIGFRDGFRGLMENRIVPLEGESMIGLLTLGGTILGTSRDKPHKMPVDGTLMDMTDVIVDNYHRHHLDASGLHRRRRNPEKRLSPGAKGTQHHHPAQDH